MCSKEENNNIDLMLETKEHKKGIKDKVPSAHLWRSQ